MGLIDQITEKLGVSKDQAEGATGALLNFARNKMGQADFQSIIEKIPGAEQWMAQAPSAENGESGGGGLMGSIGSMASSLGGSLGSIGSLAGLTAVFSKLGLGPDSISGIVSTISGYLGDNRLSGLLTGMLDGEQDE